jgi:hypothetical protein
VSSRWALGVDPGREGAAALVELGRAGAHLHGLWLVRQPEDRWHRLAAEAALAALARVPDGVTRWASVEKPPATFRAGSIAGLKRGHRAWAGLGAWQGGWRAHLSAAGWPVHLVEVAEWTRLSGVARSKAKAGGEEGRVREAQALVYEAGEALARVTGAKARGDAAEAILIALAGCLAQPHRRSA